MEQPSKYVVAIGIACMDEYYTLPHWPILGDKTVAVSAGRQVGGMIPNAACVLAQNGIHTYLLDTMPESAVTTAILHELSGWGVDVSAVLYDPSASDACCGIYLTGNERTILVTDSRRPAIRHTPGILRLLENATFIYCAPYNLLKLDQAGDFIRHLTDGGVRLALDIESWDMTEQERGFAARASILFFNEFGFRGFRQGRPEQACVDDLLNGNAEAVVITLGKQGSRCYSRMGRIEAKSFELPVRDTTGAGDTYNAAFLSMWIKNQPISVCTSYANLASNRSVTLMGARAGAVPEETVYEWYRDIRNKEKPACFPAEQSGDTGNSRSVHTVPRPGGGA